MVTRANFQEKIRLRGLHKEEKMELCNFLYSKNLVHYCTYFAYFVFFHTSCIFLYFSFKLNIHIHAYILDTHGLCIVLFLLFSDILFT